MHKLVKDGEDGVWCGPTALALLTGLTLHQIERIVKARRRDNGLDWRQPVHGMCKGEMLPILKMLGYEVEWMFDSELSGLATLGKFIRHCPWRNAGPALLRLKGHFAVVEGELFADSHFPAGIPLKKAPKQRQPLLNAWLIKPVS